MLNAKEIVVINVESAEISLIIADILDNGLKNIKSIETRMHAGISNFGFIDVDSTTFAIKELLNIYQKKAPLSKLFVALASELAYFPFVVHQKDYFKNVKMTDKLYETLLDEAIEALKVPDEWVALDVHPVEFIINGKSRCTDIKGLTIGSVELISTVSCYKGHTLGLLKDVFLRAGQADVYYFSSCQAINKYFFGSLPLDKQEVLLEITAAISTLSVYKGEGVIKSQTVTKGMGTIARQIAFAFGVGDDVGESILEKVNLAYNYDTFDIITIDGKGEQYSFYVNDIYKIINSVMDEICAEITTFMEHSEVMIPPFAVINLVGSGMKIKGLKDYLSKRFNRNVTLLSPTMKGWELPIYAHTVAIVDYAQELTAVDNGIINKLKKIFSR